MTNEELNVQTLVETFEEEDRHLALAESCTGGLISAHVTSIPGASAVLKEGVVSYSNRSKIFRLGVDPETIEEEGAVSEAVAVEMAEGIHVVPGITDSLSVTGIAGPSGGTDEKPVGTVWFAMKSHGEPVISAHKEFDGSRAEIRDKSKVFAIELLLDPERGVPLHER